MEHTNPYYPPLADFFEKIVTGQSMLGHLINHLQTYAQQVVDNRIQTGEGKDWFLQVYSLVIGDLTDADKGEWKRFYPTGFHHEVSANNYLAQVARLTSREAGFTVAQSTEYLDSFKKDILATYFHLHPDEYKGKVSAKPESNTLPAWQEAIRDKGNRKLIDPSSLKLLAPHFAEALITLPYLEAWHSALLAVRNAITHAEGRIPLHAAPYHEWDESRRYQLERAFPVIREENHFQLSFTKQTANRTTERIAEFAFLIFKSFSLKDGYDWQVLAHMREDKF